ncbi:MAG: ABC transporter substrate-binding protein [Methylobacteriaceae bacterium]|nr:ABC transporter substrate-binding protein [Methylobacteriaceae bacterium]
MNDKGGINGRKIRMISYDDAYSPPKTVEQARRLVGATMCSFCSASLARRPMSPLKNT